VKWYPSSGILRSILTENMGVKFRDLAQKKRPKHGCQFRKLVPHVVRRIGVEFQEAIHNGPWVRCGWWSDACVVWPGEALGLIHNVCRSFFEPYKAERSSTPRVPLP
jgi:hypothetical protein